MTEIKEGYDIPSDLKHTPKPWFGLSNKHALLATVTIAAMYGWYKLTSMICLPSIAFRVGFIIIGILAICAIWLELDMWMYRFVRWIVAPFYVTRFDKAAKQVSGIPAPPPVPPLGSGLEDEDNPPQLYWNSA